MKILAPFIDQAGRRRTLYRYYHVQPRYEPPFEVTGSTLRRLFFWGAVAVWFVWWIF